MSANDGHEFFVAGFRFPLNLSSNSALVRDKVILSEFLTGARVRHIAHYEAVQVPDLTDYPIVVKPRAGTGGVGVVFIAREDDFSSIEGRSLRELAWSRYLSFETELRVVLLDHRPLVAYLKHRTGNVLEFSMHNVSHGARVEFLPNFEWNTEELRLAMSASRAVGLRLCSVDIALPTGGSSLVLEVNDGIMLEGLAGSSLENRDRVEKAYRVILEECMR